MIEAEDMMDFHSAGGCEQKQRDLLELIELQERLLACYRSGNNYPSGKLLDRLGILKKKLGI